MNSTDEMYSFRGMHVWKNAYYLSVAVFEMTKGLPRSEDYALTSQIRRSSNSVSANIAEGFGRKTKKDKNSFYTISRGSAFETQNHLLFGSGIGYFEEGETQDLVKRYNDRDIS